MMTHKPIRFKNLSLSFPHNKTCFEAFNFEIHYGSRIALIGRNGSGKSCLLNIVRGALAPTEGEVFIPTDAVLGYVPQCSAANDLSGAERFNQALTEALSHQPNILLLDEPTNHLDRRNKKSLLRMLDHFDHTLIVVSHDVELLRHSIDTFLHLDDARIHIFSGHYDDYVQERQRQRARIERQLVCLDKAKKSMHQALMKEQTRAAHSRAKGEKSIAERKWPTIVSDAKARMACETSGRKKAALDQKKQILNAQLSTLRLPEIILPKFSLHAKALGAGSVVFVDEGAVGYPEQAFLLQGIHLSIGSHDRMALEGDNGSGKSTLVKALLNDASIVRAGNWCVPNREEIGYLDQHYATLMPDQTVLETLQDCLPDVPLTVLRQHLNDFLFRKNEEVYAKVATLSGGEKARLSLAQIAAKTPKLLILDEVTNNLDLETRDHVIQVLKAYPGALLVISHDEDFLAQIGVKERCHVNGLSRTC